MNALTKLDLGLEADQQLVLAQTVGAIESDA
jgi:hypothetical protein